MCVLEIEYGRKEGLELLSRAVWKVNDLVVVLSLRSSRDSAAPQTMNADASNPATYSSVGDICCTLTTLDSEVFCIGKLPWRREVQPYTGSRFVEYTLILERDDVAILS